MLPTQILLNNLLYDLSEIAIPFDAVDAAELRQPHTLDVQQVQNFMWMIGPISSLFDFLTFWVLLKLFAANEALFQSGWFIESMCTQVLVIFVIRTRGNPFKHAPHPLLMGTSMLVVLCAIALPYTALGSYFGLVPPPPIFFVVLAPLVLSYLLLVEMAKRRFYHWQRHHHRLHRPKQ
jgi:Mg2+-importing ATPase